MVTAAKMGMEFTACAPADYFPDEKLQALCQEMAKETGAKLNFISDVETAVKGADVIYTDVWVSMGEPFEEWQKRIDVMKPYQVSSQVMEWAVSRPFSCTACLRSMI